MQNTVDQTMKGRPTNTRYKRGIDGVETMSKGRLPSLVFQIVVEEVKNGVILFFHSLNTYMK